MALILRLILLFFPLSFAAQNPDLVTDTRGIEVYLKKVQSWEASEIVFYEAPLSPDRSRKFRIYTSQIACGRGLCPQYVLEQMHDQRWRLIGTCSGHLSVSPEIANGLFDLESSLNVGSFPNEGEVTRFSYNGKAYTPKK